MWCSCRRRRYALRSLTPLRPSTARNTKKRTHHHTAAADDDAKPLETATGAGAGAGATAAAACLRFAARDVCTANALYVAYGNNGDGVAVWRRRLLFLRTEKKAAAAAATGFLFFEYLCLLRTERGKDFEFWDAIECIPDGSFGS